MSSRSVSRLPLEIFALAAVFGGGCVTAASPQPTPPVAEIAEDEPATPGSTADFARLRAEYGERRDFGEICEEPRRESRDRLAGIVAARDWDALLEVALGRLDLCPVDIEARYLAAVALAELGRDDEVREQLRWYRGLIDSILASGDGTTPESAYEVISVAEEYDVLAALDLQPKRQALVEGRFDAMTVESEDGELVVYFDPAAHFRRLGRWLDPDITTEP